MELTRQDVYDLIWSKPMSQAAGEVGMTPTGLAKLCSRLSIPNPPRGYWRKRPGMREQVQRPSLPVDRLPADEPVTIGQVRSKSRLPQSRMSAAQREAQLIAVGVGLIREEGLAACTIARVAAIAGISESLAFSYCKSRDDLLANIARKELEDRHAYRRAQVKKGRDLEERVRLSSLSYLESARESGSVFELLMQVPAVRGRLASEIEQGVASATPVTADYVSNNSRWSDEESFWKTHLLTIATQRVANLQAAGVGSFEQCAKVALAMTGISYRSHK